MVGMLIPFYHEIKCVTPNFKDLSYKKNNELNARK